jgi:hypothetical protein
MKYVLLIYQPKNFDAKALSEDEYKAVAAEYAALTGTPNLKPGLPLGFPKDAITVRMPSQRNADEPRHLRGPHCGRVHGIRCRDTRGGRQVRRAHSGGEAGRRS